MNVNANPQNLSNFNFSTKSDSGSSSPLSSSTNRLDERAVTISSAKGTDIVNLLFKWDYENIGNRVRKYLFSKDVRTLREVCTDMCLGFFQKGAFNLSVTPDRLGSIRPHIYPRLYPRVRSTNCICLISQPLPADALVCNVSDVQTILKDSRFIIKSVVFRGKPEDLEGIREELPQNLRDNLIFSEKAHLLQDNFDKLEESMGEISPDANYVENPPGTGGEESECEDEEARLSGLELSDNEKEISSNDGPEYSRYSSDEESAVMDEEPKIIDAENRLYNSFIGVNKLPSENVVIGKYLASGAFGRVYRGSWGDKPVALKQINLKHALEKLSGAYITSSEIEESMRWEVSRLSTANHPNLVQFYGMYQDGDEGYSYLVMEFCEGGTVQGALEKEDVSWGKRWQWALQITEALEYLHSEGVLHRDLKAENILLDRNGRAKLADLGVAQVDALLQETEARVVQAGLQDKRFIAPENMNNQTVSTKATDIYALGLVFWQIVTGSEPAKLSEFSYRYEWREGKHIQREIIPKDCPESFKQLIISCWEVDPAKRPSVQELVGRLEALGAEFDPYHHVLIKGCETLEKLIHPRRKEGLSYIAPFVTEHRVEETIESYWGRIESSKAKGEAQRNPPLALKETFKKFIESPGSSTLLLLGEAGLGKTLTTYLWAEELLSQWWAHINKGEKAPEYFPLFIRASVPKWSHESIKGAFLQVAKEYNLPNNIPLLVFIDGYDELGLEGKAEALPNLVNHLGLQGVVNAKLIVTCRPNTVERNELEARFSFSGKLETRHFLPFSIDQLLTYLKNELSWDDELHDEYKKTLENAESVRTVLRNPFVLHLMKESWETVSKRSLNRLNRWHIYEGFIEHIFKTQSSLLSENLHKRLIDNQENLLVSYQEFASRIAFSAFQKNGITLEWKEALMVSTWANLKDLAQSQAKDEFAQRQEKLAANLKEANEEEKNKLTRRSLLTEEDYVAMIMKRVQQFESELPMHLRGEGLEKRYKYSHKSLFEYFIAKRILMLKNLKNNDSIIEEGIRLLQGRPIQAEKEALNFFEEGWGEDESNQLKEPLFEIIKASRYDSNITQASANAATLLASAHVSFSGRDLSKVRIKGADLSDAVLSYTCLCKADLQDVILHRVWLESADLREANLQEAKFGEFPHFQYESGVECVSYSKDGLQMAIGLYNGSVQLYKKEEEVHKHIATLNGHTDRITSITYSPDGKQLASGSCDNTIGIWDTRTLQLITQLKGHMHWITSVMYSPDGKKLASGSCDNTIGIWDTANLKLITQLKGHTARVLSVTYSPDGKQLASGSSDNTVGIWNTEIFELITQLKWHTAGVNSVTYSPDGKQLASGSDDKTVGIWDTETLELITQLKGHTASIASVTYSRDSNHLASGSYDKMVGIWDTVNFQLITQLKGHTTRVMSVAYSPEGKQLVSGSYDKTVRIWDARSLQFSAQLKGHTDRIMSIVYSPDGKRLASGSYDKTVRIWDVLSLQPVFQLRGHTDSVMSIIYSPDGEQLTSGSGDHTVRIWDTAGIQIATQPEKYTDSVRIVMYSPDGKQLAFGSGDHTVGILDMLNLQLVTQLKGHTAGVASLTYRPDGKQLASGSSDNTVRIWNVVSQKLITELKGHTDSVNSVTYSPDGKQLASGSSDNTIGIWNMASLELTTQLKGHTNWVFSVTYRPDSKRIASGGCDSTIGIWDVVNLKMVTQLKGHVGWVNSVTYSPDGKQLASGSSDRAVFVWAEQDTACLPEAEEKWQLIRRFENSSSLSAHSAFLKGAKMSANNLALLKQKGANDDQDIVDHSHLSWKEGETFKQKTKEEAIAASTGAVIITPLARDQDPVISISTVSNDREGIIEIVAEKQPEAIKEKTSVTALNPYIQLDTQEGKRFIINTVSTPFHESKGYNAQQQITKVVLVKSDEKISHIELEDDEFKPLLAKQTSESEDGEYQKEKEYCRDCCVIL